MTLQEILAMDTSKMSLDEMVYMLDGPGDRPDYQHDILELRLRHEDDTDIPMEEDSIGRQCRELGRTMLPGMVERLGEYEASDDKEHFFDDEGEN
ncbi:MAG: hypothetical protein IJG13_24990 [Kiritimatiellae bacterium]|nr:hypothetical protein [Kiritimatiellia bacterium]MBQ3343901.1 hypothetical protein [Kiritimatiellia bacterium]